MKFIQTGNNDKDGSKTFINLDRVTLISKIKNNKYILWEGFSGLANKHEISNGEIGYKEIKEILGDF